MKLTLALPSHSFHFQFLFVIFHSFYLLFTLFFKIINSFNTLFFKKPFLKTIILLKGKVQIYIHIYFIYYHFLFLKIKK